LCVTRCRRDERERKRSWYFISILLKISFGSISVLIYNEKYIFFDSTPLDVMISDAYLKEYI